MAEHKMIDVEELMRAAETGERERVAALLAAGADVNAHTTGGETALMRAAARGRAAIVRLLLERGADPNLRRQDHWTALMLAAFFGHTEAVCELVAGGADALAADRNGSNALAWASSRGNVEAARFLKDAVAVAEMRQRTRAAERVVVRQDAHAPVASERVETSRVVAGTSSPRAEVSPVSAAPPVKDDVEGNNGSDPFVYADVFSHAPVPTEPQAAATPVSESRKPGAVALGVKEKRTNSRLGRLAIYAAPLLLVVCGALAYRLFVMSNSVDAGEGRRATQVPEAQQPVQTQGQPVSPNLNTPSAEQQPVQSATPGVVAAPEVGTPAAYPSGYAGAPTYTPAEIETLRAPVLRDQPPGRPAGGEPSVVSLGQSETPSQERRTTEQTTRAAEETPARDERRDAPRPAPQDTPRASRTPDNTPKTSPTPKPKVIPWP